jgi:hypothetical protein
VKINNAGEPLLSSFDVQIDMNEETSKIEDNSKGTQEKRIEMGFFPLFL